MKTLPIALIAMLSLAPFANADYSMPPIEEVLKTAPIIVDGTVTKIGADQGTVCLKLHRVLRGDIRSRSLAISKTSLSCFPASPASFGAKLNQRYIFVLQSKDTLYEKSTMYPVTGSGDELRVRHPIHSAPAKAPLTFAQFDRLVSPAIE